MKRVSMYLGLAFAACMACFSMGAMAEPLRAVTYQLAAIAQTLG